MAGICAAGLTPAATGASLVKHRGLPVCPPSDYQLQTDVEHVAGNVIAVAWFSLRGPYPCRLHSGLRFAVQPADDAFANPQGAVGAVDGNPVNATVDAPLTAGAVVTRAWVWQNWCGDPGQFTLFAQPAAAWDAYWTAPVSPPDCVATDAPSSLTTFTAPLPRCQARDYRLATLSGQGYRGRIVAGVKLVARGGTVCRLRQRVSLTLQREAGSSWVTVRQIRGNPEASSVGAVLAPGSPVELFWSWQNWCGTTGRFRWLARTGADRARAPLWETPVCGSTAVRSALTPFFNQPYPVRP